MSVHRFGDAALAAAAIPFFADSRALGTALQPAPAIDMGDKTAALTGRTVNGTEYSLYLSTGPLLFRVSGIAPTGDPRPNVESMMSALFVIAVISQNHDQEAGQTIQVAPDSPSGDATRPSYSITDLGAGTGNWGTANHINNRGQVLWMWGRTGTSGDLMPHTVSDPHIMLWQDGTVTDLSSLGIGYTRAINDVGTVLAGESGHTVVYQSDTGILSPLSAFDGGDAVDINNAGAVVGVVNGSVVIATTGSIETIPMPEGIKHNGPAAINDAGQVAGSGVDIRGDAGAFLFADGTVTFLPDARGVDANRAADLNDAGQVVGHAGEHSLLAAVGGHAFVYDAGTETTTDLGSLPDYQNSVASAINNEGQVVGYAWGPQNNAGPLAKAYIYDHRSGVMTDLNQLIPEGSGWQLVLANDINDAGQIVGRGLMDGEMHAFLLTPTR
jgi:probable HAF family extracellular repeat protein